MDKYWCLTVSIILCLYMTFGLRRSLRGVLVAAIKRFPFWCQTSIMAAIGVLFTVVIAVLTFSKDNALTACMVLLFAETVVQVAYNVVLFCVHKRRGTVLLAQRISELGFDEFSDPVAVKHKLVQVGYNTYTLNDVVNALNIIKKDNK